MDLFVNNSIRLKTIDHENAALLFPLFRADIKELRQWFPFPEDYKLEYDLAYVDEKKPPLDETFVIYYNGEPCGRIGLYDCDQSKGEIYLYYWVASPFRRKHIAIDSVLSVMEYLRSLGLKRVLFDVKAENEPSIALINRLPNATTVNNGAGAPIYACSILQHA